MKVAESVIIGVACITMASEVCAGAVHDLRPPTSEIPRRLYDPPVTGRVVGVVPDEGLVGISWNGDVLVVKVAPARAVGIEVGDTVTAPSSATVSGPQPSR